MAHTVINGKFYVDTAFLNSLSIPGVSLEHMGFGEFYATTPHGTVDFDRMRGVEFPGQSGRSHQAYDREGYGTKATEWLIGQVEKLGKSVRVAASNDTALRGRIIRLAHSRPELREHLLPLVKEASASEPATAPRVGDILYSSWGYDQTNIDFYEIVQVSGSMVVLRELGKKVIRSSGPEDYVIPVPGQYTGAPLRRKIKSSWKGTIYVSISTYEGAYSWDGVPLAQTGAAYGR
ncbi:MAG: hypothetical protein EBT79_02255 [Actinobacteria bacterium]|nr:hypothetical protein [Actinomycetota bacterium]NBR66097.1 hypothetical protein [Actinomycetota bacterium]